MLSNVYACIRFDSMWRLSLDDSDDICNNVFFISVAASDSCEGLVSGCSPTSGSPGRGHERSLSDGGQATVVRDSVDRSGERRLPTAAVKNIISTFWSTSATLLVEVRPCSVN